MSNRGHLRAVVRADNRGHNVAAEGGAGLQQVFGFRVNRQACAVRGETGIDGDGHAGDQAAADGGGAAEQDVGLMGLDQVDQHCGIGFVLEIGQFRLIDEINLVGTTTGEFGNFILNFGSEQDCAKVHVQFVSQFAAFAKQFVGYGFNMTVALFCKDPDVLVDAEVLGWCFRLSYFNGFELAGFDTGAAQRAGGQVDLGQSFFHGDGTERAGFLA